MLVDVHCKAEKCSNKVAEEVLVPRAAVQPDGRVRDCPCPECGADRYKVAAPARTAFALDNGGRVGWASTNYSSKR